MRFFGFDTFTSEQGKIMLKEHGFLVLEEVRIGQYDLLLVNHAPSQTYHLAIQRIGKDFTDIGQQKSRIPNHLGAGAKEFYPMISYWIGLYGKLYMASHDSRKDAIYPKLLRRIGFKVKPADFFGYQVHEVTK